MKIVLTAINAKYIHSNLALRNFIAFTSDCSEHLVLKEYTINHAPDQILQGIYREHPDVLCISCYIWNPIYSYLGNKVKGNDTMYQKMKENFADKKENGT